MRKILFFLLMGIGLLCSFHTADASVKPPKKFGDIDKHNLEITSCPLDSTAPAYYIFDWGEAYFDFNTGGMILEYHARIKIINKSGLTYGDVSIPFNGKSPVRRLKAATYNLKDGKIEVSKVDDSMIYNEKVIGSQRKLKISFPDVREGSIIEWSYTKSVGSIYNLVPWSFQTDIPVKYSEFNLRIPDGLQYKFIQEGYESVNEYTKKHFVDRGTVQSTEYHWVMRDIPALKEEPFMPNINNYYSRLEFELEAINFPGQKFRDISQTWESLEKELKKSKNFSLVPDDWTFLSDSVALLTEDNNDVATIRNIHDFIGRHIKWNGNKGLFTSDTPHKIYKEGSGNSADINFMLIGLLRQAGFEAWPVILATRDNGIIRNYAVPILSKLNYVIVWAKKNDKEYLLDATEPRLSSTMLPLRCLNGKGRIINDNPHLIDLKQPGGFSESIYYNFDLNDEGVLEGKMQFTRNGYSAFLVREYLFENGRDKLLEKIKKENSEWEITSWEIGPDKEPSRPLVEKISCSIEGKVEDMGDVLILNPLIHRDWEENPFKKETRTYPVDFVAPMMKRAILNYNLPEGYSVDELPKSMRIQTPDRMLIYTYVAKVQGSQIQILSSLIIKKTFFNQEEYTALRNFFSEVLAKQSEQIIIKKTL
jgi:hypothetical protein